MDALRNCTCGATPAISYDNQMTPPDDAWAVHCSEYCGADTHWQVDYEKAHELWNAGKVKNQRGGQHSKDRKPRVLQ